MSQARDDEPQTGSPTRMAQKKKKIGYRDKLDGGGMSLGGCSCCHWGRERRKRQSSGDQGKDTKYRSVQYGCRLEIQAKRSSRPLE